LKNLLVIAILSSIGAAPAMAQDDPPLVKLLTVAPPADAQERVFFGRVVARETVDLALQVGGPIVELPVEEGAPVAQGDLIARLDREPFELALAEALAEQDEADRRVSRYRELLGSTVAETNLQDAETQAELAAIAVRDAQRDLGNATLQAPFDGIVAARLVSNYATVSTGTPVVRLHDMSDLRIEIDVPETLAQRVGRENTVETIVRFPFDDRAFAVELREFNAETAPVGQTYSITLGMAPPEDLFVLPGASARVTARFPDTGTGPVVPASAVIVGNDGSTRVMVFSPAETADEGTVKSTSVTITPTENGGLQVLSGLEPGQEIVAIGGAGLTDGAPVRRFTGFEG